MINAPFSGVHGFLRKQSHIGCMCAFPAFLTGACSCVSFIC
jgi:hypothetical protein